MEGVTMQDVLNAVNGLGRRFDGLEARFDGLEQRFDGLEGFMKEHIPTHEDLRIAIAESEHRLKAHVDDVKHKLEGKIVQTQYSVDILTKTLVKKNIITLTDIENIRAVNVSI